MQHRTVLSLILDHGFKNPDVSGLPLAEALTAVSKALEKYVAESSDIRAFLEPILAGNYRYAPKGCTPEEVARYLADGSGMIDLSNPDLFEAFVEEIVTPLATFRMGCLLAVTKPWPDIHASFVAAMDVADSVNSCWQTWHHLAAKPYQLLTAEQKQEYDKVMEPVLKTYDHTMPGPGDEPVAWITAMPEQVKWLRHWLTNLAATLDARYAAYFTALDAALAESDTAKLEAAWSAVDLAWIALPQDAPLLPVHSFENGEHPYRVSPSFRLSLRVTSPQDTAMIAECKRHVTQYVQQSMALGDEAKQVAAGKIARSDAGVFFSLAEGGYDMNSNMMGQVLPNRQEIAAQGARIFLQPPADADRSARIYNESLQLHCNADGLRALGGKVDGAIMTETTITHELFHVVGRSQEIDRHFGPVLKLLEESKATVGGYVSQRGYVTPEYWQRLVAMLTARVCRFLHDSRRRNRSYQEYTRENLVVLQTLLDCRVLRLNDDGLSADLSLMQVGVWYSATQDFTYQVLDAYQKKDAEELRRIRTLYCGAEDEGAGDAAKAIIAWVNRPVAVAAKQ